MTTSIVLLVLSAGWAAYLAVWFKDARKVSQDRADTISSFSHGMGSLGGTTARPRSLTAAGLVLAPRSAGAAARRRREVAAFLGTLAALSFLAAFVFGLVHGFGFAGVLGEMQLPTERLAPALFGFNVGVEIGQLGVVVAIWPLLRALEGVAQGRIHRLTVDAASAAICGIGVFWFVTRAFG